MCCIPLTLTMSSPWIHQMSPQSGDISVAPLEGHWAGYLPATCNSALQALTYLLTGLQKALEAVSSKGQEAWDPWAGVPPHRSPAAKDKEPACAAWALWCSPSCTGTSEIHLQPHEPSWGDLQGSGAQAAGVMVRKGSTEVSWHCSSVLGASLPRAVTRYESYLA